MHIQGLKLFWEGLRILLSRASKKYPYQRMLREIEWKAALEVKRQTGIFLTERERFSQYELINILHAAQSPSKAKRLLRKTGKNSFYCEVILNAWAAERGCSLDAVNAGDNEKNAV